MKNQLTCRHKIKKKKSFPKAIKPSSDIANRKEQKKQIHWMQESVKVFIFFFSLLMIRIAVYGREEPLAKNKDLTLMCIKPINISSNLRQWMERLIPGAAPICMQRYYLNISFL